MRRTSIIAGLLVSASARAQWTVTPQASGGWTTPSYNGTFSPLQWDWEKSTGYYSNGITARLSLTYKAKPLFTWTNTSVLPPSKVYVKESGNLYLTGNYEPWMSVSIPFEIDRSDYSDSGYRTIEISGHRYQMVQPSGNTFELPEVTYSAAGYDTYNSSYGRIRSDGSYSATALPHYFIATKGSAYEPNYRRADAGEPTPVNPLLVQNLRDRDKWITLDLGTHYDTMQGKWRGSVELDARYYFWSDPVYTMLASGSANPTLMTNISLEQNDPDLYFETLSASTDTANTLGTTSQVQAAVTSNSDSLAPVITNKINIRWHKDVENWRKHRDRIVTWNETTCEVASPGYAIYGGSVMVSWTEGGAWLYTGSELGTAIGAAAAITGVEWPWLGALFSLVGLTTQYIVPKPSQNSAVFDWGGSPATYSPNRNDSLKEWYVMYPSLELSYDNDYSKGDGYAENGYYGPVYKIVEKFNGGRRFVQNFVYQGTGGGSGGSGGGTTPPGGGTTPPGGGTTPPGGGPTPVTPIDGGK